MNTGELISFLVSKLTPNTATQKDTNVFNEN